MRLLQVSGNTLRVEDEMKAAKKHVGGVREHLQAVNIYHLYNVLHIPAVI